MKIRSIIWAAAGLLILASNTYAGHGHSESSGLSDKFYHKYDFLMSHKEEIGLTDPQTKTLDELKFQLKRKTIETEAKQELAMVEVWQELNQDKPDMAKVDNAINAKYAAKAEAARAQAAALVDLTSLLDENQRTAMKKIGRQEKGASYKEATQRADKIGEAMNDLLKSYAINIVKLIGESGNLATSDIETAVKAIEGAGLTGKERFTKARMFAKTHLVKMSSAAKLQIAKDPEVVSIMKTFDIDLSIEADLNNLLNGSRRPTSDEIRIAKAILAEMEGKK